MSLAHWIELLLSDQNPLLPSAGAMQWYLRLGWIVPLMVCALWLMHPTFVRLRGGVRAMVYGLVCAVLLLWVALPGSASLTYWLGLAFNAPAVFSVVLCCALWRQKGGAFQRSRAQSRHWVYVFAGLGVVLGYVLLLDLLAVLPLQLYAFGFSPAALALVLMVSLVPCIALNPLQRGNGWTLFMPLSLLVFVGTRLPTGNVWDVVLDPLLWVALQVYLVKTVRANSRSEYSVSEYSGSV